MREREWLSQTAAGLSRLLWIQGSDEAETFSVLSHDTAPAENITAQAMWRAASTRVLIRRGAVARAMWSGIVTHQVSLPMRWNTRANPNNTRLDAPIPGVRQDARAAIEVAAHHSAIEVLHGDLTALEIEDITVAVARGLAVEAVR